MRQVIRCLGAALVLAANVGVCADAGVLTVAEVTCEYAVNPIGVDHPSPRFGWVLQSDRRGQLQTAYQILVSTSEQSLSADTGDKWDSGKVLSDRSVSVPYGGKQLASGERCYWKVRCWDRDDRPSAWSAMAWFEMALLEENDWLAPWIMAGGSIGYVPGKSGQAVALDGISQSVRIPHSSTLKPASQITLTAWILPSQMLGDDWREIYRKDDASARHLLAIGKTGSTWGVWVGLGIGGSYVEYGAPASREGINDGQWHLVTATYDGVSIRVYLDGTRIGSLARAGTLDVAGGNPAYVGSTRGQSEFFPGWIDDLRVYRRALLASEIQSLLAGSTGTDPDMVGWWRFDGDLLDQVSGVSAEASGAATFSPLLRKSLQLDKPVERARIYMSGVGWSELYVNGTKAGDNVLDPAATDYDKRVLYVTHDVTAMLRTGTNVLGVMLGNGWFSEPPTPGYGETPRLRLQMHVRFTDGTSSTLTSDDTWRSTAGPIIRNDIFGGESYDARLEKVGWLQAGYDDSGWTHASIATAPGGIMESQKLPPIKVIQTIRPIALTNPAPGIYVYDMGQLFGGWVRIKVKGPAGTKVTMKYSARVFANTGLIDKTRHPEPKATDYYILKGDPVGEVYEPRFTYHPVGYVQLEGYPGTPTLDDVEGRVVHSAIDLTGDFECPNPVLNQIHRNAVWTLRNELYGFPLDCLYREHWGWLEPGTNPSTLYARKFMPLFWQKFLRDARYAQFDDGVIPDVVPAYPLKGRKTGDPAWAGNYPLLVWYLYEYFDDRRLLEEHYPIMKKWLDHLTVVSAGHLVKTGYYGDHMLPGPAPGREEFISTETPPPLLWTGFYYRNAMIVSRTAEILGHAADTQQYAQLAQNIKDALNAEWFDSAAGRYATGSQTANLFPLVLGIVPDGREPALIAAIADNIVHTHNRHFHTGNLGTSALMEASLAEHGLGDLMRDVLIQPTYPGYGYMIAQGATTLWEAWGLRDDLGSGEESMDMWGSVDEFFYKDLAGIQGPAYFGPRLMTPGFQDIDIKPHVVSDLDHVNASIKTVRGIVSSRWRIADGLFTQEVGIPVNSTAHVNVPLFGTANVTIRENGRIVWDRGAYVSGAEGVTGASTNDQYITFDVGSGSYTFTVPVPVENRAKKKRYSAIQPAINASESGDEIVVLPGVYAELLNMGGKNVVLRAGSSGVSSVPQQTVIQGDGTSPVISFTSQESRDCQLVGFVITGGANLAEGGGVLCRGSSPTIANCCIQQNTALRGAGIAAISAAPLLVNCVFRCNSAEIGGAIYSSGSQITMTNCTVTANFAPGSAALACRSPRLQQPSSVAMSNCILWDGGEEITNYDQSTVSIAYSNVLGGWPGTRNCDIDPRFVRPPWDGGDGWGDNPTTAEVDEGANDDWGDLSLRPCSPCIDVGADSLLPSDSVDLDGDGNTTEPLPLDIGGFARVQGSSVNMGAYESLKGPSLQADLNGDCTVDDADTRLLEACKTGPCLGPPPLDCANADLDHDGDVDQSDFGLLQRCHSGPSTPADLDCAN